MNFEFMKSFMDSLTDWIIPGNSIVVYKDKEKIFEYSSGYADVENKAKMTGREQLYIYSCSKIATVTAALQLYERGKFLLTDPLYEYLPEFKDMNIKIDGTVEKAKKPILVRDLFTMTAGLSYDTETEAFQKACMLTNGHMDTRTVIKCLAEEPLMFEPGDRWNYSLCHDVLAVLTEVVSGTRFSEYVKRNIFDALDMKNSYYHPTSDMTEKMARQYIYETGGTSDIVELQRSKNRSGVVKKTEGNHLVFGDRYDSGGAGIITTVNDYALLAAALANSGRGLNKNRILSRATVELMKTNHLSNEQRRMMSWPQLKGYGYGLGVRTMLNKAEGGSNGPAGEFGWGGAAGATVLMDTEHNLAMFYAHHMLNPQEEYYQPRLRNILYSCI